MWKITMDKLNGCIFWLKIDDLLEKYSTIWAKISADIKKGFDSVPVYIKELSKAKKKSHGDEVTDFYDKKIPKMDCNHTCLVVISFDFLPTTAQLYSTKGNLCRLSKIFAL